MKKLGFIGCGNMGEAMLKGALSGGFVENTQVNIFDKSKEKLEYFNNVYKIPTVESCQELAEDTSIIILAVKPDIYPIVLSDIKDSISDDTIIVSITPSYSLEKLREMIGEKGKLVRTMPNTPATVGCGITSITFEDRINEDEKDDIIEFFRSFGDCVEVNEELIKGVVAVSGSSPAFIFMLIEAMADGAVKQGILRKDALLLAAKAVEGSAKMVLESGKHPGQLKDEVCSPGGTTIAGTTELEQNGFRGNIIKAMDKVCEKYDDMNRKKKC